MQRLLSTLSLGSALRAGSALCVGSALAASGFSHVGLSQAGTATADVAAQRRPAQVATAQSTAQLVVGGSDSCATAELISGTGSFAFDNSAATTGPDGQLTTNCIQYNFIAITNDVWFLWTAPQTGRAILSSCGTTTVDTKIGVYAGSTCPGAGAVALACNDDFSSFSLQSRVFFDAVQNQQYLVQVGTFPGQPPTTPTAPGGAGMFTIEYATETCTHDDGSGENGIGLNTAGEIGWIARFGQPGSSTIVTAISTAWGRVGSGTPVTAGQASQLAIWDDPNDDGNPNDLVLQAQVATTVQNPNTHIFTTVPLVTPVTVSGVFFLGAKTAAGPGLGFPAAIDGNGCGYQPLSSYMVLNTGGPIDFNNLGAATTPPTALSAIGGVYRGEWLLRGTCSPANAGVAFCFGDGTGALCPCSPMPVPHGNPGKGCPTNIFAGGALAVATGLPSLMTDTLVLTATEMINGSMIFFQAPNQQSGGAGLAFGDGKRCATGTGTKRFKTKTVVGNTASYPGAGDNAISVAGAVLAPGTLYYQGWYRSANPTFCTVATYNLTNGLGVTWTP